MNLQIAAVVAVIPCFFLRNFSMKTLLLAFLYGLACTLLWLLVRQVRHYLTLRKP